MAKGGERSDMKMQTKMASAVFLLIVTAIALNALAVPVQAKNTMQVNMWGTYIGLDEVREIPTGTWATILWGWACVTWDQLYNFSDSTDYTWTLDGEPISDYEIEFIDGSLKAVFFILEWHPKRPGEYDLELTVTFNEDHFDGIDLYPAGTVMYAPRTILVTPREQCPLDPPEEPM